MSVVASNPLFFLIPILIGYVIGIPTGRCGQEWTESHGWSQKGRDSVSIALYLGATALLIMCLTELATISVQEILMLLTGGIALGFAVGFRHVPRKDSRKASGRKDLPSSPCPDAEYEVQDDDDGDEDSEV